MTDVSDQALPEGLADLPPSAELVYRLLVELDEPSDAALLEDYYHP